MQATKQNAGAGEGQFDKLNWPMIFVEGWAISLQAFLHRRFGERYLGLQAASVLVLIPFYTMLWPHDDLRPMMLYLLAYLFMCLMARLGMALRRLRGESPIHSRYNGYPFLMWLMPGFSEVTVKTFVEPLLAFFGGVFMLPLNKPLGFYWMAGAAMLLHQSGSITAREKERATDMHDSALEQEELAERFRGMRGESF
jgi:hypothetical protein